jgi:hypothetical protein
MTTQTKTKRQELFLDPAHPNYAELINAGLTERDYCEFQITSDGKAIAFNFDSLDTFMAYLSKLQGSRVECKLDANNVLGWKYTDSFCLDNRPDGEGWVKFDVLTYHEELKREIPHDTATGKGDLLYLTAKLTHYAYGHKNFDVFFRFELITGFEMESAERNLMSIDNALYMGIVFNLTDVKS